MRYLRSRSDATKRRLMPKQPVRLILLRKHLLQKSLLQKSLLQKSLRRKSLLLMLQPLKATKQLSSLESQTAID